MSSNYEIIAIITLLIILFLAVSSWYMSVNSTVMECHNLLTFDCDVFSISDFIDEQK